VARKGTSGKEQVERNKWKGTSGKEQVARNKWQGTSGKEQEKVTRKSDKKEGTGTGISDSYSLTTAKANSCQLKANG
jgi:hypothetical protein